MITNAAREIAAAYLSEEGKTEAIVIGEIISGKRDDAPVVQIAQFILNRNPKLLNK